MTFINKIAKKCKYVHNSIESFSIYLWLLLPTFFKHEGTANLGFVHSECKIQNLGLVEMLNKMCVHPTSYSNLHPEKKTL